MKLLQYANIYNSFTLTLTVLLTLWLPIEVTKLYARHSSKKNINNKNYNYCKTCGYKITSNARQCKECGALISKDTTNDQQ